MRRLLMLLAAVPGAAASQIIDRSTIEIPDRPSRTPPGVAAPTSAFQRDRDVSVLDRNYAAFVAQGVAVGPFDLFPALEISPEFTSNIFADNARRRSAMTFVERPELTLRTRGGPVDVDLYGKGQFVQVPRYTSESTEEETGGVDLAADVGPLARLAAGGSVANRVLPRYAPDSPVGAAKPLEYTDVLGYGSGSVERGRFRLTARGDVEQIRFRNGEAIGGTELFTKDRDRTILSGLGRLEYAVKPNFSVYLAGTGNSIDYRLKPPAVATARDSHGWGGFVGTSFELTSLMRGDVRVGYIRQIFDRGSFRPIQGLGLKGSLAYFPTRLTTVTLRGERSVQDSGVPGTGGVRHANVEGQIDHELRRYLIATAIIGHIDDRYRGLDRRDRDLYAGIEGTYLSRAHWNAKLGYQFTRRRTDAVAVGTDYDDHRLLAALTFQI